MTIIYMRNVEGKPKMRALTRALPCIMIDGSTDIASVDFEWDGSSSPPGFNIVFPRFRHPIASCKHDSRCEKATCKAERKFADEQFQIDVAKTSWKITSKLGYWGVRIGAFFGVGSNF